MDSIIVVPDRDGGPEGQIRLRPGQTLVFGRATPDAGPPPGGPHLALPHEGVSRTAGRVAAAAAFWTLSNLSGRHTYVVENPEGAGEHIKVPPGRLEAPVPFEFSRVVLPTHTGPLGFDVWAPHHEFADAGALGRADEHPPTVPAFALDHAARYFLVLAALTEPRLRGAPHAPLPTVGQLVERLRPVWPQASATSVQWNIDYLAVKLRLKSPDAHEPAERRRLNGKKEALAALALRFDLVREDQLSVLSAPVQRAARAPQP